MMSVGSMSIKQISHDVKSWNNKIIKGSPLIRGEPIELDCTCSLLLHEQFPCLGVFDILLLLDTCEVSVGRILFEKVC